MKMNILTVLFLGVLLTSCGMTRGQGGSSDDFDYGHIEDGKYVNSFFKFEITLPDGWVVQSQEQMDNLTEKGTELAFGENKFKKAVVKASLINTANLLQAFQYELGAPVDFNPNISIVAENISNTPGIKTGGDYLFHLRKMLKESLLDVEHVDENFEKETIGGRTDFYKMKVTINYLQKANQIVYATISNGFSLCIVITSNDEVQQQMLKTINTIKFH